MKKISILYINTSYDFSRGVNANRVFDLLTYFSKRKFNVIHITPEPAFKIPGVKNIVVPYSWNKKPNNYLNFVKSFVSWTDCKQNETWVKDVRRYLSKNKKRFSSYHNVLINTQPRCLIKLTPFLKEIFNANVIVDFHDPFSIDMYRPNFAFLDKYLIEYEKKILKQVDALLVIAPSMLKAYRKMYPKIKVVYVPHVLSKLIPVNKTGSAKDHRVKKIIYGGSLHGRREAFPLLNIIGKNSKDDFRVQVIGKSSLITRLRYFKYHSIEWLGSMSKSAYLNYFNENATAGLVVQSFAIKKSPVSAIAAKTYEYLAMNKPIIYIGPDGDNKRILEKYSNNYVCYVKKNDSKKLAEFITNFKVYKKNTRDDFFNDFQAEKVYLALDSILK